VGGVGDEVAPQHLQAAALGDVAERHHRPAGGPAVGQREGPQHQRPVLGEDHGDRAGDRRLLGGGLLGQLGDLGNADHPPQRQARPQVLRQPEPGARGRVGDQQPPSPVEQQDAVVEGVEDLAGPVAVLGQLLEPVAQPRRHRVQLADQRVEVPRAVPPPARQRGPDQPLQRPQQPGERVAERSGRQQGQRRRQHQQAHRRGDQLAGHVAALQHQRHHDGRHSQGDVAGQQLPDWLGQSHPEALYAQRSIWARTAFGGTSSRTSPVTMNTTCSPMSTE
jgi:hypothetical protein